MYYFVLHLYIPAPSFPFNHLPLLPIIHPLKINFMRNVSRILPLLPGIAMLSGCNNAAQKSNGQNDQKPNIIYIFADDLGIGDLSCYGATKVSTPILTVWPDKACNSRMLTQLPPPALLPVSGSSRVCIPGVKRTQVSLPATRNLSLILPVSLWRIC